MNVLETMKQALEALESCDWNDNDFPDDTQYFDRFAVCEAATNLRAAIAELEKVEPVAWHGITGDYGFAFLSFQEQPGMTPLYAAPVAPVKQEPVAWMDKRDGLLCSVEDLQGISSPNWIPLYTAPVALAGWRFVPEIPTGEMLDALGDRMWKSHTAYSVWEGMLNAAPEYGK